MRVHNLNSRYLIIIKYDTKLNRTKQPLKFLPLQVDAKFI